MIDCCECRHSCNGCGQLICQEQLPVKSASWRRRFGGECGPEAKLFKQKEQPKKEVTPWSPY